MATSKAFATSNARVKYTITIKQNSQSVSGNYSNVIVSVRFYRTNTWYTTYGTGTVYCKINGTTCSVGVTPTQKITSAGIVLFSKTLNINHNADFTSIAAKYLYIDNEKISGYKNNNLTGSGGGITFKNNEYVLRYVIGV